MLANLFPLCVRYPVPGHAAILRGFEMSSSALPSSWKSSNSTVPCTVFAAAEIATVDKLITLTHGKAVKAARDQWSAVARARHNREVNNATESALDLLEKFLNSSKLVSIQQRNSWSGDYPLTILDEAIKRLAPRLGYSLSTQLAAAYPGIPYRAELDAIVHDIGLGTLTFPKIRKADSDFADAYGIPKPSAGGGANSGAGTSSSSTSGGAGSAGSSSGSGSPTSSQPQATPIADQKSVRRVLRKLKPKGQNRAKVVTLIKEMLNLNIQKNPLAFCFLLRSAFEIAAKAYCSDNQANGCPSATHANGNDRQLLDILNDVYAHLTNNGKDKARVRVLHGATTELGKASGILSVTSLNQLIHSPGFSVQPGDVCIMFGNVVPLLEAMC